MFKKALATESTLECDHMPTQSYCHRAYIRCHLIRSVKKKKSNDNDKSKMDKMVRRGELPYIRRSRILCRVPVGHGAVLMLMERKK
jgi:hypothetical protein